jgi:DNA-binding NtrC family response regulator
VTRPALRKLSNYPWPGNVRQLENVLIRALVLGDGRRLTAADVQLPDAIAASPRPLDRTAYAEHESRMIAEALHTHGWNVAKVARVLRVSRPTLYRRMRAYGLERTAERTDG